MLITNIAMTIFNDWILSLHQWREDRRHHYNGETTKFTSTDCYTSPMSLNDYQLHCVLYFDYINTISMYDCIIYTKLVGSLLVAYVDQELLPRMELVSEHNHTVSYWKSMRPQESTMAAMNHRGSYKLRRLIIYHPQQFPYIMFVYDTDNDSIMSSSTDDEAPRSYRDFHTCKRQLPLTDFNFKRTTNRTSVGTQTDYAEMYSLNNRPICTPRSMFLRETSGVFNKTNVIMTLPDNLHVSTTSTPQHRLTPIRNMLAISSMLKKEDNNIFETYDMYNMCKMCRVFFFTKTLNSICLTCAREHNISITAEPLHYVEEN